MTDQGQQTLQQADEVIRDFIVEQAGLDMGDSMTDQAVELREKLQEAVLLRDKEVEESLHQYALRLQMQIDEITKVHARLERSAKSARDDGDDQRARAYDESAEQIRAALKK